MMMLFANRLSQDQIAQLRNRFGERLRQDVSLANYTAARVGGKADFVLTVQSAEDLESAMRDLWALEVPFTILGSGANVLVSDHGVRGVVILNRAQRFEIQAEQEPPTVWAESGANLGLIARTVARHGLSGLEWAATIPGTLGGAIYGNAGAHGQDMAGTLILAEILHRERGKETWTCERLAYGYRTSALKREPGKAVILSGLLKLNRSTREAVQAQMDAFIAYRKRTQPPGASMGSVFKNPPGDYAGRLIEQAGLKGTRVGGVEVSPVHANFFVTNENATASDYWHLICLVRQRVYETFGVALELEIERIGDWLDEDTNV
ncbi:UDP-N-acetylmuramate dehydrogenase [Thermanaerothrix sp. 4228-RoL]|uniref:UDP-N-acetylenolpyruvoylglucosamine reductase n=1 Tax=Thermanaerothrix solaris TaxID=3058434 RepID=A0ABU3NSF9_9CHLR|nr:UDP-N-acetylmuramate dehydrogenase [Thermanaerothrix sp. 4228-RoL]MDT8899335.1 UDP-N-acetylmuramate dehydrogenase [Thermanaerothrix sp. 4228-RoL]